MSEHLVDGVFIVFERIISRQQPLLSQHMHGLAFDQDRVGQISSGLMFGEYSLHELRAR